MACATEHVDLRLWSDSGGGFAWLFSLGLHAAALAAMGAATDATPQGAVKDVTREGGIVLVARQGGEADYFADQNSGVVQASYVAADEMPSIPTPAPVGISLPTAPMAPTTLPAAPSNGLANRTNSTAAFPGRGHERAIEAQVFGVRGKGTRFVYVFDRSSSMEGAPLVAAKRELVASLQSLQSVHQFQIIFYNQEPHMMPDFRGRSAAMVFADEPGKRLAANFIGSVFAYGSTDHIQALRAALQMRPDVIFLLTDANEPQLRAGELMKIRELNAGTSINAIEFGIGPPAPRYNFLQQLAAENGGQHVYVDVTRLGR